MRDGIAVAIVGPPNAGKSSLLNQLARREAAITSPIAGTTRDVIEVAIDLGGYPVVLADTAGLRDSADDVEQEGLRRALARAEAAELRLFVFDAARAAGRARGGGVAGPRHAARRQQDRSRRSGRRRLPPSAHRGLGADRRGDRGADRRGRGASPRITTSRRRS